MAQYLLKQSEINKKILFKSNNKERLHTEWSDLFGKFRDEHVAEYNAKKNEFLAAAKTFNKMNLDTLASCKVRLHSDYEEMLNLNFLKEKEHAEEEECDPFCCCLKCTPNKTGTRLRKRTLREMRSVIKTKPETCILEPWFKKHLYLHKFIYAARKVIIQNRLLKVLQKLKKINFHDVIALESMAVQKSCEEYHCHPVFLKFL